MRCMRALPIHPLMPATGSRMAPVATLLLGGLPEKTERPHLSVTRTPGTPSIIMSPDCCPWTQIRLGAGTRNAPHSLAGRQQMT